MRAIIRWLAEVSGVANQIRTEERKHIGGRIYQDHYWWNGGLEFHGIDNPKIDCMNAFKLYGNGLRDGYPDIQRIRQKVYEAKGKYIE